MLLSCGSTTLMCSTLLLRREDLTLECESEQFKWLVAKLNGGMSAGPGGNCSNMMTMMSDAQLARLADLYTP